MTDPAGKVKLTGLGLWVCRVLDWHNPGPARLPSMAISPHAICRRCGRELLMDSQGNWFARAPAGRALLSEGGE